MISESDGKGWLKAATLQCSQSPHVQSRGAMGASCSSCGRRDESRTDPLAIMRAVDEATFASLEAEAKTAEVLPPKHAVAPTVLRPSPSRISPRASALQRLPEYPFGETSSVAPPPSSNGHTNGTARRIQFAWLAKAEEAAEADDDASTPLLEALRQPNPSAERVLALITPEAAQQPDSTRMLPLHWAVANSRTSEAVARALLHVYPDAARRRDSHERLPLHYAARYASLPIVRALIHAYPDGVRARDRDGKLPLHLGDANELTTAQVLAALIAADLPTPAATRFEQPPSSVSGAVSGAHGHSWTYALASSRPAMQHAVLLLLGSPGTALHGSPGTALLGYEAPGGYDPDGYNLGTRAQLSLLLDATDEQGRPALEVR